MKTWKGVREIFIEPRICGVYLICVDTDHGMRFYIGHTNNPVKRFAEHHQIFVEGLGYRNMRMLLLCEAKKESKRVESEKCFITAGRRLHLPLLNERTRFASVYRVRLPQERTIVRRAVRQLGLSFLTR